jgi:peptide/nickel transport system permease protein
VQLGLLPSAGGARLSQLILPVMVLGGHTAGVIARVMRSNVRDVLNADFVQTARAKGLSELRVLWRHVLRAAWPPVIGVIALQAGFLLSGTVITESMFVRPGLGRLLLDAVAQQDYPVVLGIVVLAAITYSLVNLVGDLVYRWADPRVTL